MGKKNALAITLLAFEKANRNLAEVTTQRVMEFHISAAARQRYQFKSPLFCTTGNVILADFRAARLFAKQVNDVHTAQNIPQFVKAGNINAMGLIDEILHYVCVLYRENIKSDVMKLAESTLESALGKERLESLLLSFVGSFPPRSVYEGTQTSEQYLNGMTNGVSNRESLVEELIMLRIANENPAFKPFLIFFDDSIIKPSDVYQKAWDKLVAFFATQPAFGPDNEDLISVLRAPARNCPDSLSGQLDFIRSRWGLLLGDWLTRLFASIDMIKEEEKASWAPGPGGGGAGSGYDMNPYEYGDISKEYERYSSDLAWMPRVVLLAKSTYVWLDQLSRKYGYPIHRLDQIPNEELDEIAQRGFTGLWLIGLWERSYASCRIKQICGNPEAAASAYSLQNYEISGDFGGWEALNNLRTRAWQRGIRMAADMVPNHTGMDSTWVAERPDLFVQNREPPFPGYSFNGENLSRDGRVSVYLEDHYYSKNDCAVVFKRVDNASGDTRYIYHGNDGTGMPWNDTAQLDFLNPDAREAVIQEILHVARNFPIIRFDAAMVLAKKHIQRLWYPEPGHGGDIASRAEHSLSRAEFEQRIPEEFWREVVDRCAREVPDTLLLAEAFWMMEGYFVRTLGMHRVYNSAFMNMLKREENAKYRATVKNTMEFDPEVMKRFVNFMNNPDEDTAVNQFGDGDKYFGVCTLMVTMPGLPMFGHGQVEGFREKYGMEYKKAYWDESENLGLIGRHQREIFPLMRKRYLFAEITHFYFYDFWCGNSVNENVFAYSNRTDTEGALVLYNNSYEKTQGWVRESCAYLKKEISGESHLDRKILGDALNLTNSASSFCLLHEQRSNLWYIRCCADIYNYGLFVALNGYESQVFIDIHEVTDDEKGYYRQIHDQLNGAGVPDIQVAIQELCYKDLFIAFSKAVNPEIFTLLYDGLFPAAGKKALSTKKITEVLSSPVGEFLDVCTAFFNSDYIASIKPEDSGNRLDSKQILARFGVRIARLLALSSDALPEAVKPLVVKLKANKELVPLLYMSILLQCLKDIMGDRVNGREAVAVFEQWCLDRKLRDSMISYGVTAKDAHWAVERLKCLGFLIEYCVESDNRQSDMFNFFTSVFEDSRCWQVFGVNSYNNILWFNAELMEQFFVTAKLTYAVVGKNLKAFEDDTFTKAGFIKLLEPLVEVAQFVRSAYDQADFQVAKFLEALRPQKKETILKTLKTRKKTATKKTTL